MSKLAAALGALLPLWIPAMADAGLRGGSGERAALTPSPELRSENLDAFVGTFSGGGTVAEGPDATIRNVRCSFKSSRQGASSLALRGACTAFGIVSRSVSADLVVDSKTGRVAGTYTGARVGAARLSGARQGLALKLDINWPRPVFGNMTAQMRIDRSNPETLRIIVLSRIGDNEPARTTTDLILNRR